MPFPFLLFQEKAPPTLPFGNNEVACTTCGRTSLLSTQEIEDMNTNKSVTCPKSRKAVKTHQIKPLNPALLGK